MTTLGRALACLLLLAAVARAGEAEDKAAVKRLYDAATKHYNLGEFKEALDAYKEAYRLRADAVFLFNIGQCYRQLDQPAEAARQYRAYLREQPDAGNRPAVEKLIKDMDEAVRQQRKQQPPLGTEPPQPQPTHPPTTTPAPTTTVTEAPSSEPERYRPDFIAISLLVAGGVVIAGGIALLAWSSALDTSAHDPTVKTDLAERQGDFDKSHTVRAVGWAMVGVGAAAAIASVVKFVIKPKRKDVALGFGFGNLVLSGSF